MFVHQSVESSDPFTLSQERLPRSPRDRHHHLLFAIIQKTTTTRHPQGVPRSIAARKPLSRPLHLRNSAGLLCTFERKVLNLPFNFVVHTFNMYSCCFDKIHFLTQFALLGRPGIAILALDSLSQLN